MAEIPQMYCMRCSRPFLWKKHKQYCSDKCADDAAADRASKRSQAMMKLPVAMFTEDMRQHLTRSADSPEALALLLTGYAPAGAIGYRVGCTQPVGGGKFPCIRWFPSSLSRRVPIYKLEPFEVPSVPIPWDYVVAYFDAQNRVLGEPAMRVRIDHYNPKLNWSTGDRNLKVGPPEQF